MTVGFVQRFEERELERRDARGRELLVQRGGQELEKRMQACDRDALVLRQCRMCSCTPS